MRWWRRRTTTFRDAVGAVPIVLVFIVAQQIYGAGGSIPRATAIVVVMGGALTVRRRWPLVTFGAALLTVVVATTGLEFLAIASYTLVVYEPRARPAVVACVALVAETVGFLRYWPALVFEDVAGDLVLIVAIGVLPAALGLAVRRARQTKAELQARNAELVALREEAAAHAVDAERFRIARELHDVVAHHVSAMTVRARAGRHVAARDADAAADALGYIAAAGSDALTAMGSFVGALRGEQTPGARPPQPALSDLPALLEAFRGAGLVVHADVQAAPVPIGSVLGLNAYRIVQEALTNVIRHGAAERAWVRVWFADEMLRVQVDDDGRGLPATDGSVVRADRGGPGGHDGPGGHGLVGMAERAALHDGTSALSSSPRGGCRLEAALAVSPRGAELATADTPAARP